MLRNLIITTNSPGEVAAWVKPVVGQAIIRYPKIDITVIIPPCTFASGREAEVISSLEGVSRMMEPRSYIRYMLSNRAKSGLDLRCGPGSVAIHLGGDFFHTAMVAKRLRVPAIAYTEGLVTLKTFSAFCVPYESTRTHAISRGIPSERIHVIGNLMVDAVKASMSRDEFLAKAGIARTGYVLLLPGSRPYELARIGPLFLDAAREMVSMGWTGGFLIALSPFATLQKLTEAVDGSLLNNVSSGVNELTLSDGFSIHVVQGMQYEAMLYSKMAMTIPGTNTAELAVLGTPMLVSVPLNWPQDIPLEGLPGLIGKIPVVGSRIKALAVTRYASKVKFTALPNRIADREIVHELRGILSARDIAKASIELLNGDERLKEAILDAQAVMGRPGAVNRLLDVAEGLCQHQALT